MLFDVSVPNIGTGYTGITDTAVAVPVAGVLVAGTLTADPSVWDSNTVRVKIPSILSESTVYITFSTGIFSDIAELTGSSATTFTFLPDLVQLPVIAVCIPVMNPTSDADIAVFTSFTFPVPATDVLNIPDALTLSVVSITELTGSNRSAVEITVDVSDIMHTFKCAFRVYDGTTRLPVNTVGVNNNNSIATTYNEWDGYRIRFKADLLGGQTTVHLIRVGNFEGTANEFTQAVNSDLQHNLHFSGSLVDSVTGAIGVDSGVAYNSDKMLQYYRALQLMSSGYAKITATTNTNDYSVSFWFSTVVEDAGVLCFSSSTSLPATVRDLEFSITSEGYFQAKLLSGAEATLVASDKVYADSQWHHAVLTSSATEGLKLYLDTSYLATSPVLTRTIATTFVYLGWSNSYFDGMIDEFRVYDKCLTQSEVSMLYSVFDGTVTETEQQYQRTSLVKSPSSRLTSLSDVSALQGTPIQIYKYRGIDETILRQL
jgi:hypothetical protein